jgi:hypothetical protein
MNANKLQSKLIEAARKEPLADQVPYAFEKRIMACLAGITPLNYWALWGRSLWRAALSCVAITLLCGLWSITRSTPPQKSDNSDNFAQTFESAVYASADQRLEDVW